MDLGLPDYFVDRFVCFGECGQMLRPNGILTSMILACGVTTAAFAEPVDYDFQVRGIVRALPSTPKEPRELLVKHEPIPDYRDSSGKVVGMNGMTMPFYLDSKIALDGVSLGDSVVLDVQVRTKPVFSERVVALRKPPKT